MATHEKQPKRANVGRAERLVSSLLGGALTAYGVRQRSLIGTALAALGVPLAWRGISGHCAVYQAAGIDRVHVEPKIVDHVVTINRSASDLYTFWHNFENLPQFMSHLRSVRTTGQGRSHWVANAPAGTKVEWDAEVTEDKPNELIAWRSLADSDIQNAGEVRFRELPEGRGTEVHVTMEYTPPAGRIGVVVAKLFGEEPAQQVRDDLRKLKQLLEAREVPTTEGQSSARKEDREVNVASNNAAQRRDKDLVQVASEQSFPASDPPAWTGVQNPTVREAGS